MIGDDTTGAADDEQWFRLELLTETPQRDSATLMGLSALGIEVQDDDTYVEGVEFPPIPAGKARLIAFFNADDQRQRLEDRIVDALPEAELVSLADYQNRSWETAWMRYFEAIQLSPRVRVGPPWDRPEPPEHGIALVIEPGMAFGTGSHATTRLCAGLLDELIGDSPPDSLLDVGCGSAILSMAAAGLGVDRVVGIDVDPKAVDVARTNIEENGFSGDDIELSDRPLADFDDTFDVVVANILAPILLQLREPLLEAVAPAGSLILSGIPVEQIDELRDAFKPQAFRQCRVVTRDEWSALFFQHRETSS